MANPNAEEIGKAATEAVETLGKLLAGCAAAASEALFHLADAAAGVADRLDGPDSED